MADDKTRARSLNLKELLERRFREKSQINRDRLFEAIRDRISKDPTISQHGVREADMRAISIAVDETVTALNSALATVWESLVLKF